MKKILLRVASFMALMTFAEHGHCTSEIGRTKYEAFVSYCKNNNGRISFQASTSQNIRTPTVLASSKNNLIDNLFKFIRNDALSLTVGSACLLALVTNRLFTETLYDSQSRTDILGVLSAGGLLLNGLTLQDITIREAESVDLQGEQVDQVDKNLSQRQAWVLRWAADSFIQAFPCVTSVLICYEGSTVLRKGIAGASSSAVFKAIVQKALTMPPENDGLSQPTYIPDLQVLPGRVEFPYLPELCQAVVLQPFDQNRGIIILGGNRKRDMTPKDLNQARVISQKIQNCLLQP